CPAFSARRSIPLAQLCRTVSPCRSSAIGESSRGSTANAKRGLHGSASSVTTVPASCNARTSLPPSTRSTTRERIRIELENTWQACRYYGGIRRAEQQMRWLVAFPHAPGGRGASRQRPPLELLDPSKSRHGSAFSGPSRKGAPQARV